VLVAATCFEHDLGDVSDSTSTVNTGAPWTPHFSSCGPPTVAQPAWSPSRWTDRSGGCKPWIKRTRSRQV